MRRLTCMLLLVAGCAGESRAVDIRPSAPPPEPTTVAPVPATEPEPAAAVSIIVGGDVNLGREVGQRLLAEPDFDPLRGVRSLLRTSDLAFVNLESPLSHQAGQTRHPHDRNVFTGPPSGADALARAGIGVVSIANNHSWDYSQEGFAQTLDHLGLFKIGVAGGSLDAGKQYAPAVTRVKGWTIAFFAVTDVWNAGDFEKHPARGYVAWADRARLEPEIRRARAKYDLVVVSYHGGREYSLLPTSSTRSFAREMMALGVDAFVGHHPHIPQGVEFIADKPVFYSLGNVIFGTHRDEIWTARSYLMKLIFRRGRPPEVRGCPIVIERDVPRRPNESEWDTLGKTFPAYLQQSSERWGGLDTGKLDADDCFTITPRLDGRALVARVH